VRGRNATTLNIELSVFFVGAGFVGMTTSAAGANAQPREVDLTGPLGALHPGITVNQIFSELLARDRLQSETLLEYTVRRTYQVTDLNGKVHAEKIGHLAYRAPDEKTFVGTSERGSRLIRHFVLNPLIASDIEVASGKQRHDSSISPANYTLQLLGEQQVGPYRCFVAQATPKRREKHLFEGKVWIDVRDYAVVRIEGHPAKRLSFWIKRADFVRQYQKIGGFCFPQGGFWLPQKDETFVQVRVWGMKVLTINHPDYSVNRSPADNRSVERTQSL
jgi:hypothetical protein